MNQFYKKEEREEVCAQICRVFYNNPISFNVVKDPEWIKMTGMIGKFGKGFKSPSYHEVRVKSLKLEVERTMNLLSEFKEEWKRTGCTIMSDGWTEKIFWITCAAHYIDLILEDFEKIKMHQTTITKGQKITTYIYSRTMVHKGAVIHMFTSTKWRGSRFNSAEEGKIVQGIVLDSCGFWPNVASCLKEC